MLRSVPRVQESLLLPAWEAKRQGDFLSWILVAAQLQGSKFSNLTIGVQTLPLKAAIEIEADPKPGRHLSSL